MSSKHPMEQSVLDDYNERYDLCINISYLIEQSKQKDHFLDIQQLALKRAAGCKMMIDYLNKTNILPTKSPIENNLFNDQNL